MDGAEIKERLRSNLGYAVLAAEKKAKKDLLKEGKDPWRMAEERITYDLAKNASEKVFEGMKKNERTTRILHAILKKTYLAACIAQRFEKIREQADKKEKTLHDTYAQNCKSYVELIAKMLENRTLEANTGYDRKMEEYRRLDAGRKKLNGELEKLEKKMIAEDAIKGARGLNELADLWLDRQYN